MSNIESKFVSWLWTNTLHILIHLFQPYENPRDFTMWLHTHSRERQRQFCLHISRTKRRWERLKNSKTPLEPAVPEQVWILRVLFNGELCNRFMHWTLSRDVTSFAGVVVYRYKGCQIDLELNKWLTRQVSWGSSRLENRVTSTRGDRAEAWSHGWNVELTGVNELGWDWLQRLALHPHTNTKRGERGTSMNV